MKKINQKMMAGTVAMAFLALGAGGLHAQVTQVLTIAASASVQGGYSYSYNAKTGVTTYTTAAPTTHKLATKDILSILAADYNTTFPSGAKLVMDGNTGDVQVVDKNNNLLQDVAGVMSFYNPGNNDIFSGKTTSAFPGLASPSTTDSSLLTINFDDTGIGGSFQFTLTGIGTGKVTDTTPKTNLGTGITTYTETDAGSLTSATGEGNYQNHPFVCTGSASATGTATLTY